MIPRVSFTAGAVAGGSGGSGGSDSADAGPPDPTADEEEAHSEGGREAIHPSDWGVEAGEGGGALCGLRGRWLTGVRMWEGSLLSAGAVLKEEGVIGRRDGTVGWGGGCGVLEGGSDRAVRRCSRRAQGLGATRGAQGMGAAVVHVRTSPAINMPSRRSLLAAGPLQVPGHTRRIQRCEQASRGYM